MKKLASGLILMTVLIGASGCSDDGPSAKEQFCAQRAKVSEQIDRIAKDVTELNFGDARTAISALPAEFDQLRADAADLADDVKAAVQPDLDALQTSIAALKDVSTIDELETALADIESQLTSTLDSLKTAATC